MLALSALALLATACAQTPQHTPTARSNGGWERPASYDPPGPPGDPWGPWIRQASRRFDVPERWIREVMRQESGGRVGATSPVGAMGLMQVMPGTYRELQSRYGLGDDPYHPYDSIMAGTAYIREMYDLYGSPAFLAAYNAGPRRLEDYLWNNRGLPNETRNYVRRIGPRIVDAHPNRRAAPEVYAAAEIPLDIPAGPRRMDQATMIALREQRQAVDPGIRVAQLPPGPVVRMDPIQDGTTTPAPVPYQVAAIAPSFRADPVQDAPAASALAPPSGFATAGSVVRMDPIPDGSTPEGAARLAEDRAEREGSAAGGSSLAVGTLAPPTRGGSPLARPGAQGGSLLAAAAIAPPRTAARAPAAPGRAAAPPAAAARAPSAPPAPAALAHAPAGRGFGLVGSAHAAGLATAPPAAIRPAVASAAAGAWTVQVGAYATESMARAAAGSARDASGAPGSRPLVQPVAQGRVTLYRARVTGLSQPAAQQLCDRMRARGGCAVIAPD